MDKKVTHLNSGDFNSGDCNSGSYNSGDFNSGHYNSGDYNSGHSNSGDFNSGDSNSGFFNTDEGTVRMFNRDTGLKLEDIDFPHIVLPVNVWVPESEMTEEEKSQYPEYHVAGAFLRQLTYKEAWQRFWSSAEETVRQQFTTLPNFDSKIFEEITGIDVHKDSCAGKIVEIDGKKYQLKEV